VSDDLPVLPFASPDPWEDWLREHGAQAPGVWLKIAKKNSGIPSVTYAQALEAALCHGWIDGQKASFDKRFFLQRFTPRRPRSGWSKRNVEIVARLVEAGRMQPAGLAQVDAAKADGRWAAAYDGAASATVPEDLQRALDASPAAAAEFGQLNGANRYAILYRVQTAKRAQTRERRIAEFVAMLERGERLHP
jgi:uncharacterized protein YdeI (YjbR/CyaY-like superfamily)